MKRTTSTRNVPDETTEKPSPAVESKPEEPSDNILKQLAKLIAETSNSPQPSPKKGRTISKPTEPSTAEPKAEPPVPVPEPKPKRQLSEKQLSALAAGRAKNPRFRPRENPAG